MPFRFLVGSLVLFAVVSLGWGQDYQPKFKGDPAKSESEAAALGFMRTVVTAEKNFKAKHNSYAPSLQSLAGTGSITRRTVASNKRGDYTAAYKAHGEGYELTMTPDHEDATHRAFFVDQSGKIKAEEDKPATAESPAV
jgi:hypothetical protein